jgi:carbamoylphosphate synthase small subunit
MEEFDNKIDSKTKSLISDLNLMAENNEKIIKNKSNFLKIKKIGCEEIKNILYDYGVKGNSLESIEEKHFDMNFNG